MKNFKTIVVALDFSKLDAALLNFARHFSDLSDAGSKIYFVHIIPTFVFPGNTEDLIHGITSPGYKLDELVEAKISKVVQETFGSDEKHSFEIIVQEGHPLKSITKLTQQTGADLLLIGNKKVSEGSGIVAKMIARKVSCAVCFVTERAQLLWDKVVVPMDFSPFSIRALKEAIQLNAGKPGTKIHALHVLDYPPTTQYLTRNYGLLAADWEERVFTAFDVCLQRNNIPKKGIHFTAIKNEYFNTAEHIREFASDLNAGLIVLGAQGHSSFDDLFLGSVAEKLVTIEDDIPILIVR